MTASNLLAYLNAVGVTIQPPPPAQPHSLADDLRDLEARLGSLEGTVETAGEAVTSSLEDLAKAIRKLERELTAGGLATKEEAG